MNIIMRLDTYYVGIGFIYVLIYSGEVEDLIYHLESSMLLELGFFTLNYGETSGKKTETPEGISYSVQKPYVWPIKTHHTKEFVRKRIYN